MVAGFAQWSEDSVYEESISPGEQPTSGEVACLGDMVARSLIMQRLFSRLRQAAPHLRIVSPHRHDRRRGGNG